MRVELSPLGKAFVEDHRHLTQGFRQLLDAIRERDVPQMIKLADRIDTVAGPHIRFEETVLYPLVREQRGSEYAQQLYREHRVAVCALRDILTHDETSPWTDADWKRLEEQVQTALDHTVSCGTLLSHLTSLSAEHQQALHQRMEELRKEPHRWTRLPEPVG